jgi:hypothetical protein
MLFYDDIMTFMHAFFTYRLSGGGLAVFPLTLF